MAVGYGEENKYAKYGQPTLDLIFTGPKESVTDRAGNVGLEFTRSSTATYVGSDGLIKTAAVDEARFDHDKDGNGLGLLIEESRTNELTYSEDFTQSPWTTTNTTVTANSGTAPDGTNTATFLAETNVSNYFGIYYNSSPSWTDCTTTVYVKANGRDYANLYLNVQNRNFVSAMFDLVNLTSTVTEGSESTFTSHSASIEEMPNGWRRLRLTVIAPSSVTRPTFFLNVSSDGSSPNTGQDGRSPQYQGDSTKGLLIWGTQSEFARFPTSYIPTTSSTVTRAVDVAKITGTNFTDFYNQNEGTAFVNYKTASTEQFNSPFSFRVSEASDAQSWGHWTYNGGSQSRVPIYGQRTSPNETQYLIGTFDSIDLNRYYKVGISQDGSNMSGCIETDTTRTRSMTALPTMSVLALGWVKSTSTIMTGHISRLTYWPRRLSDSDLQSLTE